MRRLICQVVTVVTPVLLVLIETGYKWGLDL
jgi:hypothetical protein